MSTETPANPSDGGTAQQPDAAPTASRLKRAWGGFSSFFKKGRRRTIALFTVLVLCPAVGASLVWWPSGPSLEEREPWVVYVIIGISDKTSPEFRKTLEFGLNDTVRTINENGGVAGRPMTYVVKNETKGPEFQTSESIAQEIVANPNALAVVGMSSSTRANPVIPLYSKAGIPIIGGFSLGDELKRSPSTFSVVKEGPIDIDYLVATQLWASKGKRLAFLYRAENMYSEYFLERVKAKNPKDPGPLDLVYIKAYPKDLKSKVDDEMAKEIRRFVTEDKPEVIVLSLGATRNGRHYKVIRSVDPQVPIYSLAGKIHGTFLKHTGGYPSEVYDVASSIPGIGNVEIESFIGRHPEFFGDNKLRKTYCSSGLGYGDRLSMIAHAYHLAAEGEHKDARAQVVAGLTLLDGKEHVFRGRTRNYWFEPSRFSSAQPFIVKTHPHLETIMLSPEQWSLNKSGTFDDTPVAFCNVEVESIHNINDSDGTFDLKWYFELKSKGKSNLKLEDFEVGNIAYSDTSHEPLLQARMILEEESTNAKGEAWTTRLYNISSRLTFNPKLAQYPVDQQRFGIQLAARDKVRRPILIQPLQSRDTEFESRGWKVLSSFVGLEPMLVRHTEDIEYGSKYRSFYQFSYVWELKRMAIDFILKIGIPLLIIILVTYIVLFIPRADFVAACGITTTALLSAIALFLATPKPKTENVTMADAVFFYGYGLIFLCLLVIIAQRVQQGADVGAETKHVWFLRLLRWMYPGLVAVPVVLAWVMT